VIQHIVGIDPGLVHTGLVRMVFDSSFCTVTLEHEVISGAQPSEDQAKQANLWAKQTPPTRPAYVYIEGYKPRHHYGSDPKMIALANEMRRWTGGKVLLNTGVKKVVKKDLMILLGVWQFGTVTHHQDRRATARIALLGMLKDPALNRVLADIVRDHLNGATWAIVQ
jgi:hypothetical protein